MSWALPLSSWHMAYGVRVQIVRYGGEDAALLRCIASVVSALRVAREEFGGISQAQILLGDAGGQDGPLAIWSESFLQAARSVALKDQIPLDYVVFGKNTGHGVGQNLLAARPPTPLPGAPDSQQGQKEEVIVFANPDTYLVPSCLARLLRAFEEPKVAIAEARQIPLEHPKVFDPQTGDTPWASGCLMAIRREVFDGLRGFEPAFFLQGDDVDLSWRVRMTGYHVRYVVEAAVFHDKRPGPNGDPAPTELEVHQSMLARLILATRAEREDVIDFWRRWANEQGSEPERDAVKLYERMREAGELPLPYREALGVDEETVRKVATFVEGDYAERRF